MFKIKSYIIVIASLLSLSLQSNQYAFIENKGQWESFIKFRVNLPNGVLFLEESSFTYLFYDYSELTKCHAKICDINPEDIILKKHAYRVSFVNSSNLVDILAFNKAHQYYNYYLGSDPAKWKSEVPAYHKVLYQNIYPKIDLEIYTQNQQLKYDFIIHPGGDPNMIKMLYEGIEKISLHDGALNIKTSIQQTIEEKPYTFQQTEAKNEVIPSSFIVQGNTVGFKLGTYNKHKPLIIDPTLIFASYSGSTSDNFGMTATYDFDGNFYTGGTAFSNGYPTTLGAFQTTFSGATGSGITDVVVSKISSDGTTFMYSTYIGGSGTELPNSMVVNNNNELFIYGSTSSTNFPTTVGVFDNTFNGGNSVNFVSNGANFIGGTDIFVAKFNINGSSLLGSTYVGGNANDGINYNASNPALYDSLLFNYGDQCRGEIILDNSGNCYVTSSTRSSDFPVINSFGTSFNGRQDAVAFKLNSDLTSMIWSTYLGGTEKDAGYSIKVDELGNTFVCGGTASNNFPTTAGVLNTTYQGGKADGFISKISPDGSTLLSSTYIGTNVYDQNFFIEIDSYNEVYILGQSQGNIPVVNATYFNTNSKQFIQKINNALNSLFYSTIFGNGNGQVNLSPSAFLVDQCQNVYISGWGGNILVTTNPMNNMPTTPGALYPTSPNGYDFYLAVFERNINSLLYATYYGGPVSQEHVDGGTSRFDKRGVVYQSVCTGCGSNDDFPTTPGVISNTNNSFNCNNGVLKYDFEAIIKSDFTSSDTQACAPISIFISNESTGATNYYWDYGNGTSSTSANDTMITYHDTGVYIITLIAMDSICQIADTIQKTITLFPNITYFPISDTILCLEDTLHYIVNTYGSANEYIWSSNPFFTDTINNSITDSTFSVYVSGNQVFYISASNGTCKYTDTVQVQVNNFTLNVSSTPANCGVCNGEAMVNVLGDTTGYTYLWNDPNTQTSNVASGLCVNNYTVTVTDSIGCAKTLLVSISDTANLLVSFSDTIYNTCHGNCIASMTVNPIGGTPPYTFEWNDPNSQTDSTAINLCAGVYQVTITDTFGCKTIQTVTIPEPQPLQILSADIHHVTCYGLCNGSISINVIGGTPTYSFQWDDPNTQTSQNLANVCAGQYHVTITDTNGCGIDSVFTVLQPESLLVNITASITICFNECNGYITAEVTGGTNPYEFQWNTSEPFVMNDEIFSLCPGLYPITIRDSNLCEVKDTITISTNNFSAFPVNLTATPDTIMQYQTSQLSANPENSGIYIWSPANTLNNATLLNPIASPLQTTTYTFTVFSTENPECKFDSTITIYVVDYICGDPSIYIPNAFTPNKDGNNDILRVRGNNLLDLYFAVFNRWGEKVFETTDNTKGWDGIYNNRESDPGVFDYYLQATCPNQEKIFIKGNVTLIR